MLLTLPLTTKQAVMGKFMAGWAFMIIALVLTLPIYFTVAFLGDPEFGPVFTGYFGAAMLAGCYLAVSSFFSVLTKSQVISAVLGVIACVLFNILANPAVRPLFPAAFSELSLATHFDVMQRGIIEFRSVLFMLIVGVGFLTASVVMLEDRKATFDNTQSNFERGKELIVDGNISRMDYDRMEARFRSASAALSQAQKDLEYTVLSSPFRGRVAQRHVENFEDVLAKQTVFTVQDISELDVIIDLPESVLRMVRSDISDEGSIGTDESVSSTRAFAQFEGRNGEQFPLRPKEIATKANDQTQTFRATFTMEAPTTFTVLPGMTTTVLLDLSRLMGDESVKRVPVRAVQADSGLVLILH